MLRLLTATAFLAAVSAPAFGQGIAPERRDAFIAMFAASGCAIAEQDADFAMDAAGFAYDEANAILDALMAEGTARVEGGVATLDPSICSVTSVAGGGDAPAPAAGGTREAFVAAIVANGCAMTEAEADALLGAAGFTKETSRPIAQALIAEGLASFEGGSFTLAPELCGGSGTTVIGGDVSVGEGVVIGGGDTRAAFLALVADNGCTLSEADAEALLPGVGLTLADTIPIVNELLASGAATYADGVLTVDQATCLAAAGGGSTGGGTAGASPADILFGAVQASGCTMSEAEAEATLPGLGLDMEQAEDIAGGWIAEGKAEFRGNELVLLAPFCTAAATGGGTGGDTAGGSDADRMAAAIRENGCRMTGDEAEATLVPLGFSEDTAGTIAQQWIADGLATFEGDSLVLGPALCAGGDAGAPAGGGDTAERLAQVIRDNGCRMTGADAEARLPGMGFTEEGVGRIVDAWMGAGFAALEGDSLVIGDKLCPAGVVLTTEDHTALLVAAVEANGCTMSGAEGETLIPALGIPLDGVSAIADALIAAGRATVADDVITVHTETCP